MGSGVQSSAWVVFSVTSQANPEYWNKLMEFYRDLEKQNLSPEQFERIAEPARVEIFEETGGAETIKVQVGAFTDFELATLFSSYLSTAEPPIAIPKTEIEVPIDRFEEELRLGKRPFTVMLINGEYFEVWGDKSPTNEDVWSIDEPECNLSNGDYHLSGTFWAHDQVEAYELAVKYWDSLDLGQIKE